MWINVQNGQPNSNREVLICELCRFSSQPIYITIGFYLKGKWYDYNMEGNEINVSEYVTHWMDKPDPPKELMEYV